LIFTKLILPQQIFVSNSYAEFHENPTNGLVADTRLRTDGHRLHKRHSFFTLWKCVNPTAGAKAPVEKWGVGDFVLWEQIFSPQASIKRLVCLRSSYLSSVLSRFPTTDVFDKCASSCALYQEPGEFSDCYHAWSCSKHSYSPHFPDVCLVIVSVLPLLVYLATRPLNVPKDTVHTQVICLPVKY